MKKEEKKRIEKNAEIEKQIRQKLEALKKQKELQEIKQQKLNLSAYNDVVERQKNLVKYRKQFENYGASQSSIAMGMSLFDRVYPSAASSSATSTSLFFPSEDVTFDPKGGEELSEENFPPMVWIHDEAFIKVEHVDTTQLHGETKEREEKKEAKREETKNIGEKKKKHSPPPSQQHPQQQQQQQQQETEHSQQQEGESDNDFNYIKVEFEMTNDIKEEYISNNDYLSWGEFLPNNNEEEDLDEIMLPPLPLTPPPSCHNHEEKKQIEERKKIVLIDLTHDDN